MDLIKHRVLPTLSALMFAVPLQAQSAAAGPQVVAPADQAAEAQSGGIEDIVVTARRVGENVQDVPIAISAISAAGIARQGIGSTEALGQAIPGLQFSRQTTNGGAPFIRGVGSVSATAGASASVATYVDDVYISSPIATAFRFNNVESIEVLKGPQGTLFGRNATGGVVHIRTLKPSHDTRMDAMVGYGRFDDLYGNLYATTGLTDTVAINLSVAADDQHKGYGRSLSTGDDIYKQRSIGLRSELLWEPSSMTSVLLAGDYAHFKGDIGINSVLAPGTIGLGGGTFVCKYCSWDQPTPARADTATTENYGGSVKLTQDVGKLKLVSISAYREANLAAYVQLDGSKNGANILSSYSTSYSKSFSQEVQLIGPSGKPLRWILGAFYFHERSGYRPIQLIGAAFTPFGGRKTTMSTQIANSYSAFGEGVYEVASNVHITAGLRYTTDRFSLSAAQYNAAGTLLAPGQLSGKPVSFSKLTYRGIIDYSPIENVLLYASYSRGFKSGGYSTTSPFNGLALSAPISPEVLDAYEAGLKSEFFDKHVRFNGAVFYYDYANLQVATIQGGVPTTLNAASARLKGADFDLTVLPTDRLSFVAGVSVLRTKYTSFPAGPLNVPNPATCTPVPHTTGPLTGGNTACFVDLSGNQLSRAPKYTLSLSASYKLPTEIGDFVGNASIYHNPGFFWEPDNRYRQPSYNLLNANLTWTAPNKRYDIRVYANNILNAYYYTYFSEGSGRDAGSPDRPRTYGVEVGVHF